MELGSIAARFDALEGRGELLAKRSASRPSAPEPTPTHRRLVEVLQDVLQMVGKASGDGVPMPILVAARAIRHMQGELLESIAEVPESQVREALEQIRDQIESVLNVPHTTSPQSRSDQPA